MANRIATGLMGPEPLAAHQLYAVRRLGFVDVLGVAGSSERSAPKLAQRSSRPAATAFRFADAAHGMNAMVRSAKVGAAVWTEVR